MPDWLPSIIIFLLGVFVGMALRGRPAPAPRAPLPELEPPLREEVLDLLRGRRKIDAIRRVREETGLGLKDSKDLVESLERGDPH